MKKWSPAAAGGMVLTVVTSGIILSAGISPAVQAEDPGAPGEIVHFPTVGENFRDPSEPLLSARLLSPPGSAGKRRPAVALFHGCGGLYRQNGVQVNKRDADMARRLRDKGYVVLMVDSFTPRGAASICKLEHPPARPDVERKRDAHAALLYLQNRSDVRPDRIGLLGWSNGGSAVLAVVGAPPAATGYRVAAAFYPGCRRSLNDPSWRLAVPLLALSGDADDWTPVSYCQKLAMKNEAVADAPFSLKIYPGAFHDFDAPDSRVRTMTGIPGVKGGAVRLGPDPAARDDAYARVDAFLAHYLAD